MLGRVIEPTSKADTLRVLADVGVPVPSLRTVFRSLVRCLETEVEDDLRRVGMSKERRVDPQIQLELLVDAAGFPLEIVCFEGSKA